MVLRGMLGAERDADPSGDRSPRLAVLSFPKCGRTWLKLMLKIYLEQVFKLDELPLDEEGRWHRRHGSIPKITFEHDGDPHFKRAEELHQDRSYFADDYVVLMARDPRDVMVSLYFEMTRRTHFYEEWGFDTSAIEKRGTPISKFIRGSVGRLDALLRYYGLWAAESRRVKRFLLVRYERMCQEPGEVLREVLELADLPVDRQLVTRSVERCSFERMRTDESSNTFESLTMTPADPSDPDSFKVRRGKVGGYVDYLSAEDIAWLDERCRQLPDLLSCYHWGSGCPSSN